MPACGRPVDKHFGGVVDRAEMQEHPAAAHGFGQAEGAGIYKVGDQRLFPYAGQFRLDAVRHAHRAGRAAVQGDPPFTVQRYKVLSRKLRFGVRRHRVDIIHSCPRSCYFSVIIITRAAHFVNTLRPAVFQKSERHLLSDFRKTFLTAEKAPYERAYAAVAGAERGRLLTRVFSGARPAFSLPRAEGNTQRQRRPRAGGISPGTSRARRRRRRKQFLMRVRTFLFRASSCGRERPPFPQELPLHPLREQILLRPPERTSFRNVCKKYTLPAFINCKRFVKKKLNPAFFCQMPRKRGPPILF